MLERDAQASASHQASSVVSRISAGLHASARARDDVVRLPVPSITYACCSALSPPARTRAKELFQRLAETEAAIHQMPVERVPVETAAAVEATGDRAAAMTVATSSTTGQTT